MVSTPIAYELREVPVPRGRTRNSWAHYYELVSDGVVVPGALVRCVPTGVGGPDACDLDHAGASNGAHR